MELIHPAPSTGVSCPLCHCSRFHSVDLLCAALDRLSVACPVCNESVNGGLGGLRTHLDRHRLTNGVKEETVNSTDADEIDELLNDFSEYIKEDLALNGDENIARVLNGNQAQTQQQQQHPEPVKRCTSKRPHHTMTKPYSSKGSPNQPHSPVKSQPQSPKQDPMEVTQPIGPNQMLKPVAPQFITRASPDPSLLFSSAINGNETMMQTESSQTQPPLINPETPLNLLQFQPVNSGNSNTSSSVQCDQCGWNFDDENFLQLHKVLMHSGSRSLRGRDNAVRSNEDKDEFGCASCSQVLKGYDAYVNHLKEAHDDSRVACR